MPDTISPPDILAVRFSSIGDVLLTTPLFRAIRQRHRAARVTVLTKQSYVPLLSHNPHVDRVIGLTADQRLSAVAAELRAARFTHHLDLHDNLRSRMLRVLVPGRWATYPKHRLARTILIYTKRNRYRDQRPVAERYFSAAADLDLTPDGGPPELHLAPEASRKVADWLASAGLARERPLIVVAPGAAHATKRWPAEHWRMLLRRMGEAGLDAVIVGGPEDAPLGATLAGGEHRVRNAAGLFGLQETGAVLQRATALISSDTGVMHMATGVGTPAVALFGPTVKAFGFFPYTPRSEVVELALSCRPCSSKGSSRCPLGHHRCMVEIEPETVYAALRRSIP